MTTPPVTTAETLARAAAILSELTNDNHVTQPGTIIVSAGHITILPEHPEVPIHAMLTWAEHLDRAPEWDAAVITGSPRAAFLTAKGTMSGITTRVSGSTIRVPDDFVSLVQATPPEHPAPVTTADVMNLAAATEDVLGV